jgi:Na+/melibiose symporter-like transporter
MLLAIVKISPLSAVFILCNRVMSETVCRLFRLVVTDIVDEDQFLHKRPSPISATVVGASSFSGKTSQSLAPMVGLYILSSMSGCESDENANTVDKQSTVDRVWCNDLRIRMLKLIVIVPLLLVVAQAILWSRYSLYGVHLKKVKNSFSALNKLNV